MTRDFQRTIPRPQAASPSGRRASRPAPAAVTRSEAERTNDELPSRRQAAVRPASENIESSRRRRYRRAMKKLNNPVRMATIGAAHGVRGEVRVRTFTGDPLALGDYGPLQDEEGRTYTVAALRPAKAVLVVRFREIASREAAEGATGTALYIDRSALPDDLAEDEFYHADLIGLAVRDEAGGEIGTIAAMQDFGGGDIVEIALGHGGTAMVPFTAAAIPEISIAGGFVRIDSVAAGLTGEDGGEEGR